MILAILPVGNNNSTSSSVRCHSAISAKKQTWGNMVKWGNEQVRQSNKFQTKLEVLLNLLRRENYDKQTVDTHPRPPSLFSCDLLCST